MTTLTGRKVDMQGDLTRTAGFGGRLLLNLRAVWGRAYVRIVGTNREPSWFLFEIIFPLFPICAFGLVYRSMNAPSDYLGFVILGGGMTAVWMNVLWSMAAQFFWEKETGNLAIYMIAPMSLMAVLSGMALGSAVSLFWRLLVTFALGKLFFGIVFNIVSYAWFFATFTLTLASTFCLGMMMASVFLIYGRDAQNVINIMMEPVFFLSGFYFPVKTLGFALGGLASAIPITLGLDAMRQLAFELGPANGFLPIGYELAILLVQCVAYSILARRFLAHAERVARREGRLTLRWQ